MIKYLLQYFDFYEIFVYNKTTFPHVIKSFFWHPKKVLFFPHLIFVGSLCPRRLLKPPFSTLRMTYIFLRRNWGSAGVDVMGKLGASARPEEPCTPAPPRVQALKRRSVRRFCELMSGANMNYSMS